jgi:hypothetical protein
MNNEMIQQDLTREDQTLQTVGQIDDQIQSIYNNLETLSVQQNPNLDKQTQMLHKIEELQQLKSSLYVSINNNYTATQANVAQSRNSLVDETAVNGIIGQELKNTNKNLSTLEEARFNKVRMAEINNYYSDKYGAQTNVMKTIVYFCIPILILGILMKKEFISKNIATALIGILVGFAIIVALFQVTDISNRSNMVFSEYDFPFNPDNVNLNSKGNNADQPKIPDYGMSCIGEACCPNGNNFGTMWDNTQKKCVTPNYEDSQTEGFVGERCLQNSFDKADFNVNIFKNNNQEVKGYTDNSNFAKF